MTLAGVDQKRNIKNVMGDNYKEKRPSKMALENTIFSEKFRRSLKQNYGATQKKQCANANRESAKGVDRVFVEKPIKIEPVNYPKCDYSPECD